jgi:hypothetical protein
MFRRDTMIQHDLSFALRFVDKDPTLKSLPVGSIRERIDGYFFQDYANTDGVTSVITQRALMMHL